MVGGGLVIAHLLDRDQQKGADGGPPQGAAAAQDDHHQKQARLLPAEQGGADIFRLIGKQVTRQPGEGASDDEAGEILRRLAKAAVFLAFQLVISPDRKMLDFLNQLKLENSHSKLTTMLIVSTV